MTIFVYYTDDEGNFELFLSKEKAREFVKEANKKYISSNRDIIPPDRIDRWIDGQIYEQIVKE